MENKILARWSSGKVTKSNRKYMPPYLVLVTGDGPDQVYSNLPIYLSLGSHYYEYTGFLPAKGFLIEKYQDPIAMPDKVYRIMGMDKNTGLARLALDKNLTAPADKICTTKTFNINLREEVVNE